MKQPGNKLNSHFRRHFLSNIQFQVLQRKHTGLIGLELSNYKISLVIILMTNTKLKIEFDRMLKKENERSSVSETYIVSCWKVNSSSVAEIK